MLASGSILLKSVWMTSSKCLRATLCWAFMALTLFGEARREKRLHVTDGWHSLRRLTQVILLSPPLGACRWGSQTTCPEGRSEAQRAQAVQSQRTRISVHIRLTPETALWDRGSALTWRDPEPEKAGSSGVLSWSKKQAKEREERKGVRKGRLEEKHEKRKQRIEREGNELQERSKEKK